jgi:hypothetical protein
MSNKTSHWTKEDLEAMAEQAERDRAPAFQHAVTGVTNRASSSVMEVCAIDPSSTLTDLVIVAREAQLAAASRGLSPGAGGDTVGGGWLSACLNHMARYVSGIEAGYEGGRWETGMETLVRIAGILAEQADVPRPILGIVRWGLIRIHWRAGIGPSWLTKAARVRFTEMLQEALRIPVVFEIGDHPQCVEHEDCAESAELGIACWLSRRNPGIPPARSSPP